MIIHFPLSFRSFSTATAQACQGRVSHCESPTHDAVQVLKNPSQHVLLCLGRRHQTGYVSRWVMSGREVAQLDFCWPVGKEIGFEWTLGRWGSGCTFVGSERGVGRGFWGFLGL